MRVFPFFYAAALFISPSASAGPELTPHISWSKGYASYHPIHATEDDRRFLVLGVSRDSDPYTGNLMFSSVSDKTRLPPPVTIRGSQLPDGTFWVFGRLEVSNDLKGPWKDVGQSQKPGTEISVVLPASLVLGSLNADFTPFRPFVDKMTWGRVVLPTGEIGVIELKELEDPKT